MKDHNNAKGINWQKLLSVSERITDFLLGQRMLVRLRHGD